MPQSPNFNLELLHHTHTHRILNISSHYLFQHAFKILSKILLTSVLPLFAMSFSTRHVFLMFIYFYFDIILELHAIV